MENVEKYLNLLDVLKVLNEETYEYQILNNVIASMYDDFSKTELEYIEFTLK